MITTKTEQQACYKNFVEDLQDCEREDYVFIGGLQYYIPDDEEKFITVVDHLNGLAINTYFLEVDDFYSIAGQVPSEYAYHYCAIDCILKENS